MNGIEILVEKINQSGKVYDIPLIEKAYNFAKEAHVEQVRKSGEPYIIHPIAVAEILVEIGMDSETIVAALLHDVIEDTKYTFEDITKEFSRTVAQLVEGVTKLGRVQFSTHEEEQNENVRKLLLAMSEDIRVIIIKLADRLHNMRTLHFMPDQKRRDTAKETLEVYAPIAHRLGIRALKEELEDKALRFLDTIAYNQIEEELKNRALTNDDLLLQIRGNIEERVQHICADMEVESRVKSIYGIYRKLFMQGRSIEEIYDVYAIRVIVNTVEECYNVLGVIHEMFRLIPGRFKDYISTPKQNMYQSLHTTVIGKEGIPVEVQIRTFEMHYTAEYGIASHWKYKAGVESDKKLEDRLSWIRTILNQQEQEDAEDLIMTIKGDLTPDDIFLLTPKGGIVTLPVKATVIDFAYAIHSAVGNSMQGAKVDGRIVPLEYQLRTGEIVEILTTKSQNHGPSRDWLNIAKTTEARAKIRSWFKKERREENVIQGKVEVEREFKKAGIVMEDSELAPFILEISKKHHCNTLDDFYAMIGYRGISLFKIMPRIREEYQKKYRKTDAISIEKLIKKSGGANKSGVSVEGLDNCLIKFSKCCSPLPGEEIVGFVTRGFGVSIHRKDCINADIEKISEENRGRFVKAEWNSVNTGDFRVALDITSLNRDGILADITTLLSSLHIPIFSLNANILKNRNSLITISIGVNSKEQLNNITAKFKKINSVLSVERSQSL